MLAALLVLNADAAGGQWFGTTAGLFHASPGNIAGVAVGTNWQPVTFVKGFSVGGVESLSLPGVTGKLYLAVAQITAGHYEVTLGALLGTWPAQKPFVANLVNTLLSRMTSTSSAAV